MASYDLTSDTVTNSSLIVIMIAEVESVAISSVFFFYVFHNNQTLLFDKLGVEY